jgi:hypothetical protein
MSKNMEKGQIEKEEWRTRKGRRRNDENDV